MVLGPVGATMPKWQPLHLTDVVAATGDTSREGDITVKGFFEVCTRHFAGINFAASMLGPMQTAMHLACNILPEMILSGSYQAVQRSFFQK